MNHYARRALAAFGALLVYQSHGQGGDASYLYAKAYFGDPIAGLDEAESLAFERGASLFARVWTAPSGAQHNASSCVTCHSVPFQGGAGMSDAALVSTSVVGGKSEVRYVVRGMASFGLETRRTPPLFGIGILGDSDALINAQGARNKFFGALAEHETLETAVHRAVTAELGLRTPDYCRHALLAQEQCIPDITEQELQDLVHYVRHLAAPPRLYSKVKSVDAGRVTFASIGCAGCHTPTFSTMGSSFPRLRARELEAYTDFKVHDVGGKHKVRTSPLWGLNSYGPPYWHDGSAQTIDDSVRLHGGQAASARRRYEALPTKERDSLLAFLRSL